MGNVRSHAGRSSAKPPDLKERIKELFFQRWGWIGLIIFASTAAFWPYWVPVVGSAIQERIYCYRKPISAALVSGKEECFAELDSVDRGKWSCLTNGPGGPTGLKIREKYYLHYDKTKNVLHVSGHYCGGGII